MISVIVPVYNVEAYLPACLDSVIRQTYTDLEILVVDDGSTDGSGAICDRYRERDGRIRVFHTENHGLSAARNYALDRMGGQYIAFIDSDDWFEENALQTLLDTALNAGADIAACRFYPEYVNKTAAPEGAEEPFTVGGEEVLKAMVIDRRMTEDVWNKLYRAELFDGIRYPEGRIFEDKATTYRLLRKAALLSYTPSPLIHYRNRANSLSNIHSMKSLVDYWRVYRERFSTIGGISEQYYKAALSEAVGAVSRMWRWYAGCSKEEKEGARETLDEMQRFIAEHGSEVLSGPYSRHVKAACRFAKSRSRVVFRLLFTLNKLYRSKNRNQYFK